MAEKTALQKSHSKASNAKLTLICFLLSLGAAALFAGLALIPVFKLIGIITAVAGGVLAFLMWMAVGKFTR